MMDKAAEQHPQAAAQLGTEQLTQARRLLVDALAKKLGDVDPAPRRSGATRWEEPLSQVRLGAPEARPIPADMDHALAEVIQLRHVVAHRAGRVDARALRAAPSLPYTADALVRIDRADYNRYSRRPRVARSVRAGAGHGSVGRLRATIATICSWQSLQALVSSRGSPPLCCRPPTRTRSIASG